MTAQPSGRVTLLFTDIEGSTRLLERLGTDDYARALEQHRVLLREAFTRHDGYEFGTEGDAFFVAFAQAGDALAAAGEAQQSLGDATWPDGAELRVRIGLHTGSPAPAGSNYVGIDLHRVARIMSAGHGGQIVVSPSTKALVEDELTELGEHRLKDFDEPVALFQLGDERFPPLRTISNTNLPRPASSLVGRERERDELAAMLQNGSRLVTLTGPGGSGKTRLALEVASDLIPTFGAGVFWSDLSPLRDPALVTETLAETLGAKTDLAQHIADRDLLLVLDNFEQVADAAPGLGQLLTACPRLRALITSRELLRIGGEVEYPLPPLADADAVELFCARSGLEPDTTIGELCRRLDNMPLAVELAAARSRVLTPAQILQRIAQRLDLLKGGRDADPRQQTLRATIEWSHDLLDEQERRLFARLSVFSGGCTLELAEQVAGADLDVLQSLVDKSLLRHTGNRFRMLETIHDYAHEQLAAGGEELALERKHALALLELLEQTYREIRERSDDLAALIARVDAEHDNTRAALRWARDQHEDEILLRLVVSVRYAWGWRSRGKQELTQWLELAVDRGTEPVTARLNALVSLASRLSQGRDAARATVLLAEARDLAEREGDESQTFEILNTSAWMAFDAGDLDEARRQFAAMGELARERGDTDAFGIATVNVSTTLVATGDYETALGYATTAVEAFRASNDDGGVSVSLDTCGWCALATSDPAAAWGYFVESLDVARRMGAYSQTAQVGSGLGGCLVALHEEEQGTQLLAAATAAAAELDRPLDEPFDKLREESVRSAKLALGEEAFAAAWACGEALSLEAALDSVLAEDHLGQAETGRPDTGRIVPE
jgi:predicted ATPase/class 3 adenylate cyclase